MEGQKANPVQRNFFKDVILEKQRSLVLLIENSFIIHNLPFRISLFLNMNLQGVSEETEFI